MYAKVVNVAAPVIKAVERPTKGKSQRPKINSEQDSEAQTRKRDLPMAEPTCLFTSAIGFLGSNLVEHRRWLEEV